MIELVNPVAVEVTLPKVGAIPGASGVTELDAALAGPVPLLFTAETRKVYAEPFVRPVIVADVAPAPGDAQVE